MIFKRKIYKTLKDWKEADKGSTAMLIEGARRIGKSTVAEEFAKNEYESYILIDFAQCPKYIKDLFEDVSNLNLLFQTLQLEYQIELKERKSVIIFDEVQFAPKARQAIKYLVKDGRYDYIETGSLISIRKNIEGILIPSEEIDVKMYPMDWEEFLWAIGDKISCKISREFFEKKEALPLQSHQRMMERFRLYLMVGGMPQAINAYLETQDFSQVDRVKRNIISLYEKDFNKIDPSGTASLLLHQIPAQLNSNANRYQTWSASYGMAYEKIQETISEMKESMVVNLAYHANDPSSGLAFHINNQLFKMYLGDTGLFVTLAFWDKSYTDNEIYKKLLANRIDADLGYLYENAVAQMLIASGKQLYYYTFPTSSGKHNYEIDFLIPDKHKISPIEVKSSGYKAHASLDAFYAKFSHRCANEYLIYSKQFQEKEGVTYLPFYLTPFLP